MPETSFKHAMMSGNGKDMSGCISFGDNDTNGYEKAAEVISAAFLHWKL
jgi:hypothetical protein